MQKVLAWVLSGFGGLLVVYAVFMAIIGQAIVAQNHTDLGQEQLHTGMTLAYGVGTCGIVLVGAALLMVVVARRHSR
jgi:uncharacterized membrane protein YqhA